MKYMTIKETSNKWELSERWVRKLCADGKIKGAIQFGRVWAIPIKAERPADTRLKSGKYIGWRKTKKVKEFV